MLEFVFANRPETLLKSRKSTAQSATKAHLLMGAWLRVIDESDPQWLEVENRTAFLRKMSMRRFIRI